MRRPADHRGVLFTIEAPGIPESIPESPFAKRVPRDFTDSKAPVDGLRPVSASLELDQRRVWSAQRRSAPRRHQPLDALAART